MALPGVERKDVTPHLQTMCYNPAIGLETHLCLCVSVVVCCIDESGQAKSEKVALHDMQSY